MLHIINIIRQSRTIISYVLQDDYGNVKTLSVDEVKEGLKSNKFIIDGLKLTRDNKLKASKFTKENEYSSYISRAKSINIPVKTLRTRCKHEFYIVSISPLEHTVYIPTFVHNIGKIQLSRGIDGSKLRTYRGTMKIIGGSGLTNASYLFSSCELDLLDLTQFDTSSIKDMSNMFLRSKIGVIKWGKFSTSNVRSMESMFSQCKIPKLQLTTFNTSSVENMNQMFFSCISKEIDLSTFKISPNTSISNIFYNIGEIEPIISDEKLLKEIKRKQ